MFELLRGLSLQEFKKFGDFVRSPFHNKSHNIIKLYELLNKKFCSLQTKNISMEEISTHIYHEKSDDSSKIRSLTSDFAKLIENFLIQCEWEKNEIFKKTLLLTALNQRNLAKNFNTTLSETIEAQAAEFNRDEDYYYNQIFLEVESFNYELERSTSLSPENFSKISSNIDLFFIITKLNLLHFMYYHKQNITVEDDYGIWLKNDIIQYIENRKKLIKKEHPVIYMKYLIFMTIVKPESENYFIDLKNFLIKNIAKMNYDVRAYIFGALTNYCITRCNSGDIRYKLERFKIYQLMEKEEMFKTDKYINYIDFLNLVFSALDVKKIAIAEEYFSKYKDSVLPELKTDTLNLLKAQINYYKKRFDIAISSLNNISYGHYYFYLRAKMLLSRIYYELDDKEPIEYIIDAAKHYIRRNQKLTTQNAEFYLKYFIYLNKLIKLEPGDIDKIDDLIIELQNERTATGKDWLLNKLNELKLS